MGWRGVRQQGGEDGWNGAGSGRSDDRKVRHQGGNAGSYRLGQPLLLLLPEEASDEVERGRERGREGGGEGTR